MTAKFFFGGCTIDHIVRLGGIISTEENVCMAVCDEEKKNMFLLMKPALILKAKYLISIS